MKRFLALALAVMMVLALAACGSSAETTAEAAPAAEAAAPAAPADAPAAPAEGEPSEEPTGEPVAELYPADGYSKDLEGYKQYAIDALKSDEHAPADIVEMSIESIQAVTDGNDSTFDMMVNQGRILSYADFIG